MARETAETLAVEALGFLASEPARISRFLALSGLGPGDLRQAAREPSFLAAVLGHLMEDERLLEAFAAQAGRQPADVAKAQAVLAGPAWERDIP